MDNEDKQYVNIDWKKKMAKLACLISGVWSISVLVEQNQNIKPFIFSETRPLN